MALSVALMFYHCFFQQDGTSRPKIKCGTVATVESGDVISKTSSPTRYAQVLSSEFNSVVIEHHLKWAPLVHSIPGPIHPSSPPTTRLGKYDFHHVDTMVDFAMKHNLHIKGHVLVWHVTSPPFLEDMTGEEVRECVRRHIFTTMAYFKGRIKMWDVVNESLASDGTLVENVFYRKMGENYIEECFRMAHEADPEAFLIYNDNKVEGCGYGYDDESVCRGDRRAAPNQMKSDGFYNLLKSLVDKGVPVHGAGMQAHFNAGGVKHQRPPTPAMVKRQIRRIGELGLKVNISELDVRVSKLPSDGEENNNIRALAQTQIYRDILSAALSEPSFDGIWLWGFTDRHTWVKNFYYDDAPLIFDENYIKKPSYDGIKDALKTLCPGGIVGEMSGGCKGQCFLRDDSDGEGKMWGSDWMQPEPKETADESNRNTTDSTKDGNPDWLQNE
jgi:endo-1,4-beta-xylanase